MKTIYLFIILSIIFISCSTPPKPQVIYAKTHDEALQPEFTEAEPVVEQKLDVPIVEYATDENEPSITEQKSENITSDLYNNIQSYTISPKTETYNGGAVTYNYVPNNIYKVFVSPRNIADIQLEPGETVVSPPACGDTINFQLGSGFSLSENIKVEHIYIKPIMAGKQTTLHINTDRRVYQIKLIAYERTFMPIVSFNYPIEQFNKMVQEAEQRRANSVYLQGDIRSFNFSYDIIPHDIHKPDWMPTRVFSDATKTYLHFPSARRSAYAPVLFAVENKKRVLVNYRVIGTYYVVDQVLNHAELVLDVNAGNIITIKRSR